MEAQKQGVSPVTIGIRFGLLVAVASVLIDFLTRVAGLGIMVYSFVAGGLALLVSVVGIVLAHRAFKQANGGLMSYTQGVVTAIIILLISSVVLGLFNYVYVNYVDPDFVENMKAQMVDYLERNNVPDDQIAKSTVKFDEMKPTPVMALVNALKNGLIGGVILGAIISAFTKRKQIDFE